MAAARRKKIASRKAAAAGSAPQPEQIFFADPALDRAMGVIMAMATEVYVLRDRLGAIEARLAERGLIDVAALDAEPVPEALAAAAKDRAAFAEHLLEPLLGQQQSKGRRA